MTSQDCPSNLSPRVPTEWRSSDFSTAICSAPYCGDNKAALEFCCDGHIAAFDPSPQSDGANTTATTGEDLMFLICSIDTDTSNWDPLSTELSPYLEYQNCLLRRGAENFKCNMPHGETLDDCPAGMRTAPTGDKEMTCAAENRPNGLFVLARCCGSEMGVYGYGCYAWCSGGSEMQECVDDSRDRGSTAALFCQNSNSSSNDDAASDHADEDSSGDDVSGSSAVRAGKKTAVLVCTLSALLLL
jgi:hypothetical protein